MFSFYRWTLLWRNAVRHKAYIWVSANPKLTRSGLKLTHRGPRSTFRSQKNQLCNPQKWFSIAQNRVREVQNRVSHNWIDDYMSVHNTGYLIPGIYRSKIPGILGAEIPGILRLKIPGILSLKIPGIFTPKIPGILGW